MLTLSADRISATPGSAYDNRTAPRRTIAPVRDEKSGVL
jgi:hypothetical protein